MLVKNTLSLALLFLCFSLTVQIVLGQKDKRANVWYFGYNAGIDFTGGSPKELTDGQMQQREGCSSISDENGKLILYTNGIQIWNGRHHLISEDFDLGGDITSTQSAIIIPKPGSDNIYYIFTTFAEFSCITIDMNLDGGKGGVVSKQILLNNATEKLAAVKHCNNKDFWVLTHEKGNSIFKSYLVTGNGIQSPVENNVGLSYDLSTSVGHLKFSSDARKLGTAILIEDAVELFDFDNSTGIISNAVTLKDRDLGRAYGMEFSPDGNYLYVAGTLDAATTIFQMEIRKEDPVKIIESRTLIGQTRESYFGALQLGPDNKIYVAKNDSKSLGVINFPNLKGKNCSYDNDGFKLSYGSSGMGLPNFVASFFNVKFPLSSGICDAQVFAPDIFTPNADGINDTFKILFIEGIATRLDVFDRWGTCIYTDNGPEPEWDGKVNGEDCQIGSYVYILRYRNERRNEYTRRGTVILQK